MKITPEIKAYKKAIDTMTADELSAIIKNSRLNKSELFAVELKDLYQKTSKECAVIMDIEERQFARYLHSGRSKIIKRLK